MKKLSLFFLMAFAAITAANAQGASEQKKVEGVLCGTNLTLTATPDAAYHTQKWVLVIKNSDDEPLLINEEDESKADTIEIKKRENKEVLNQLDTTIGDIFTKISTDEKYQNVIADAANFEFWAYFAANGFNVIVTADADLTKDSPNIADNIIKKDGNKELTANDKFNFQYSPTLCQEIDKIEVAVYKSFNENILSSKETDIDLNNVKVKFNSVEFQKVQDETSKDIRDTDSSYGTNTGTSPSYNFVYTMKDSIPLNLAAFPEDEYVVFNIITKSKAFKVSVDAQQNTKADGTKTQHKVSVAKTESEQTTEE